ncbi:hypothetical protein SEUCBS139899_006633 [Sporothrix eucalyptigena]|uniref:RNase III domain-containing protein n=1 Tax=Sporothrix eucalyptigena TaxID=1812306 RepID=A0ABP0B250_9PEZI
MSITRRALQSSTSSWQAVARPAVCCRSFSATTHRRSETTTEPLQETQAATPSEERPRWSYTPVQMKAPFSIQQPKDPRRSIWRVNTDPAKLDRMYEKLLGKELARALPDELKWLAVTHKSFDNGRRGFNTRLAFFGRQILALETTKTIMAGPAVELEADPFGRTPFSHPALDNVDKLSVVQPHMYASPERLSALAREVGLPAVVRWKPRMPDNLAGSGVTTVLTSTVFAIIGAVSLQHGAEVANRVVRERIVKYLAQ